MVGRSFVFAGECLLRHLEKSDILSNRGPTATVPFDSPATVVFRDDRKDYGEPRFILLGMLRGKLYQVVFTPRGRNTRIISARRANKRERRLYERLKNH